jgi:hypothetical protein
MTGPRRSKNAGRGRLGRFQQRTPPGGQALANGKARGASPRRRERGNQSFHDGSGAEPQRPQTQNQNSWSLARAPVAPQFDRRPPHHKGEAIMGSLSLGAKTKPAVFLRAGGWAGDKGVSRNLWKNRWAGRSGTSAPFGRHSTSSVTQPASGSALPLTVGRPTSQMRLPRASASRPFLQPEPPETEGCVIVRLRALEQFCVDIKAQVIRICTFSSRPEVEMRHRGHFALERMITEGFLIEIVRGIAKAADQM